MIGRALLLREESAEYEEPLQRIGLESDFVPVLDFEYISELSLQELLGRDPAPTLIVTSPRAAEAIGRLALRAPVRAGKAFAVGEETASRLRALGFEVVGEQTGHAEALANLVIHARPSGPLVFLCGDRRRETLPDLLNAAGVDFDELTVYRTLLLDPPFAIAAARYDWVAVFSPSSLEAAQTDPAFPWGGRLAAIGRTTADAIAAAGLKVEAVAERPSPEGLAIAIADSH
ncbi:uroporphyrinogen-III synthase [soil metagenome]